MSQPLPYSTGCFVCGRDNPRGLRLRFYRDGNRVVTRCTLDEHYNGFLGRTHGGVVAALLDEAMGWATVFDSRRFSYTAELKIRYSKPVPVGTPIVVSAQIIRQARRLVFAASEIRTEEGDLLVMGEGKFLLLTEEETKEIEDILIYDPGAWRVMPPSKATTTP